MGARQRGVARGTARPSVRNEVNSGVARVARAGALRRIVRLLWPVALAGTLAGALAACGRGPASTNAAGDATTSATPSATSAATAPAGATPAPTSAPTVDAAARASAIRDASARWPKVEGRWTRGATDSSFVAWFDGGRLRYLEERATLRGGPPLVNRYWFDDAPVDRALFYFDGRKPSSVPGGDGPGQLPPTVAVVAEFRGAEVVRAVAREHYGEKKLDDAAIAEVRANAAALAGAAQDEWSAKQR